MPQCALGKMLVWNIIATAAARAPDKLAFYCAGAGRSAHPSAQPTIPGGRPLLLDLLNTPDCRYLSGHIV
jgi:hypothetical protein